MDALKPIHLAYEEYAIASNAQPGWTQVRGIIEAIIEGNAFLAGWVYKYDPKHSRYTKAEEFESQKKEQCFDAVMQQVCKDLIGIIKIAESFPIQKFLPGYAKVGSGKIEDNLRSDVFPDTIEVGDWASIATDQIVLLIYHDAEPLFLLRNAQQE